MSELLKKKIKPGATFELANPELSESDQKSKKTKKGGKDGVKNAQGNRK